MRYPLEDFFYENYNYALIVIRKFWILKTIKRSTINTKREKWFQNSKRSTFHIKPCRGRNPFSAAEVEYVTICSYM